jgi:hypothetical protein
MAPTKRRPTPADPKPRPAPEPAPSAAPARGPAFETFTRPRFFDGRMLSADDLTREQVYQDARQNRHNAALHGCGVVSGLEVAVKGDQVHVSPGLALDCMGRDIVLPNAMTCPLPEGEPTLFVTIAYAVRMTRPTPILTESGGEATSAPSLIAEDVAFGVEPVDPSAGHEKRRGGWQPCGSAHGLALARLVAQKQGWKLDTGFAPLRVGG